MAFLKWDSRFSVGIEEIDEQHKHLVDLVGKLHGAAAGRKGNEVQARIISELVASSEIHFSVEEKLMETFGYPLRTSHAAEHRRFAEAIMDVQLQFEQNRIRLSASVFDFLSGWLREHILGSDKLYSTYVAEKIAARI